MVKLRTWIVIMFSVSFTVAGQTSNGGLGDVKYSVLEPKQFREINGSGWVLMDGGIDLKNTFNQSWEDTRLASYSTLNKIPDARGMFLKGLNHQRTDSLADFDGQRKLLSIQQDPIQTHNHNYVDRYIDYSTAINRDKVTAVTGAKGTYNLSLYIYIKVND
ncbi:MAG: hypothetical protein NXI20_25000 [bacterium]|nr:hypothetical protein [bacterium]